MNVGLISTRFARALYDFSSLEGEEGVVRDELKLLQGKVHNISEFNDALLSPIVPQEKKLSLLNAAVGETPSKSVQRFFRLLIDHKRENMLADICHSYRLLFEKEKGIIRARLTTAIPIDDERSSHVKRQLEKSTGKKIELTCLVQPEIIGGYILTTDEKRLDASVRTKLAGIRKNLTI
jgi:F-type H+-transporting ATPase subunit delta